MSLDKFLEELSFFNDAVDDINYTMNNANMSEYHYYTHVIERLKTAGTTLTKASFNYFLIPKKYRPDMTSSLYGNALRIRKIHRGLMLWVLYSKDLGIYFMNLDGKEIDFITGDEVVMVYKHLCTTLDLTIRLVHSTDLVMVKHGHDKITFILDMIEELMDLVLMIDYTQEQRDFLHNGFEDYLKVVRAITKKASGRLGLNG
tara:strand:+ start:3218 stop:3823 length:606 start_codon:yes stop_codon:yes gene_type:complete